jgi:hypothetical protein
LNSPRIPTAQRANPSDFAFGDLLGWCLFFVGIFLIFNAWRLHVRAFPRASDSLLLGFVKACEGAASEGSLLSGVIIVPMGFGLARRYVFGLWLAYGFLFFLVVIAVTGLMQNDVVPLFALCAWIMIIVYYQDRRSLFKYIVQPSPKVN